FSLPRLGSCRGTTSGSHSASAGCTLFSERSLRGGTVAKSNALRAEKVQQPLEVHRGSAAIPELDQLIHPRMRLGIISALAAADTPLTFNALKDLLKTTDGNLSVHARKLEEAKYIACTKSFEGRMPKTEYALTPAGRKAFDKYL